MASQIIDFALSYAKENHKGQLYGNAPYINHLLATKKVANKFHCSDEIQAACLLHDIIEDTHRTYADLKLCFGEEIAEIVFCVTDELGRNRAERKSKTYPKIKGNLKATIVKLCDRIANIEDAKIENNRKKILLYQSEHKDFVDNLYVMGNCPALLWEHYFSLF